MTGGTEGTLRYGLVAIWDDAFNEVACNRYSAAYSDVAVGATSLTPGNWYYVSVDNHNGSTSYRGTFGLCITDVVDYDFREGALKLPVTTTIVRLTRNLRPWVPQLMVSGVPAGQTDHPLTGGLNFRLLAMR